MYINAQKDKTIGNAYFCPPLIKRYTERKCYNHVCIYCLIILQNMLIIIGVDIHYIYNIRNRCNIWFSHRPRSDIRALIENGFRSNHHCIEEMLWTWDREVWLALTVFPVHLENTNEHYRFLSFVPISELHPNVLRLFLSFSRYLWLAPMFWPDISQALDPCVIL